MKQKSVEIVTGGSGFHTFPSCIFVLTKMGGFVRIFPSARHKSSRVKTAADRRKALAELL